MTLIQSKQVSKVIAGLVGLSGFSANGGSGDITTPLGTALATAGNGGVAIPLQVSANETAVGVITTGIANRAEISNGTIDDGSGNEVYGRITETGGTYTITYYSDVAGVETAYSFGAATDIDIELNYRFDFARLPADFAVIAPMRIVGGGGGTSGASVFTEALTVTATNTLSDLTKTPDVTANVLLFVNGVVETSLGTASFSIATKTITWSAANAGYSLAVTDKVFAQYTTLE